MRIAIDADQVLFDFDGAWRMTAETVLNWELPKRNESYHLMARYRAFPWRNITSAGRSFTRWRSGAIARRSRTLWMRYAGGSTWGMRSS